MKKVVLSLVAVMMLAAVSAQAQVFKLSLWDKICVPNEEYTGGLEIGIGNHTQEVKGVQFAFIYSKAEKFTGLQWSLVNNTDDGLGVQLGFVNLAEQMKGIQWGCVNWAKQEMTGAQLGFVNYAQKMTGLQWGFVNYTEQMKGIQIGLVNIIKNNPQFLPVFIIFNFCL